MTEKKTEVLTQETTALSVATSAAAAAEMLGIEKATNLWTSIPNNSPANTAKIMNAMNGGERNLGELDGKVIYAKDMLMHSVEFENDDGEMQEATRIVLIEENGNAYGSTASGIASSLKTILTLMGMPPWATPLALTSQEFTTRKKRKSVRLKMVITEVK